MPLPLFYLEEYDGTDVITLGEETSRHIVQVLRMEPGEPLQLTDGKGYKLSAAIADAHKKKCTVRITEKGFKAKENSEVILAISLIKHPARLEWCFEKATEIGVAHIVPLLCDRTEKQHFRLERMRQVLVSAMLQSQQYWLPSLSEPMALANFLQQQNDGIKLIAHCEEGGKQHLPKAPKIQPITILIGPEGDFTPNEISAAIQAGYTPVSLGNTRLRTETAAVVAAALLCVPHE